MTPTATPTPRRVAEFIGATTAYAICAYFLLAPLFDDPFGTLIKPSSIASWLLTPNTDLFIWVLSWDWHALTSQPSSFWDANILAPMEGSLAAVFPRLGHLPIFGPILATTGNAVAANQLNLLANFALSGGALFALLRHWGVSRAAAFIGGLIYAFCPARVSATATPSMVAGQYLPLALLFLDRAVAGRSWRDSILAAVFLIWQASCALAYAYLVPLVGLVYLALTVVRKSPERLDPRVLAPFATAVVMVAVLVAPTIAAVNSGHLEAPGGTGVGSSKSLGFLKFGAVGSWADYLGRESFFKAKSRPNAIATPLYMGWSTLGLALAGLLLGSASVPRWLMQVLSASTAVVVVLTLGPAGAALEQVWEIFGRIVPGASTLLLPTHFGFLFVLTTAVFAGIGVDRLSKKLGSPPLRFVLAGAIFLLIGWELRLLGDQAGLEVVSRSPYPPRVYSILREQPRGTLLEIPFNSCRMDSPIGQARTMYDSTSHWRPILNGFGELRQSNQKQLLALSAALPDPRALDLLSRIAGLRHVIARTSRIPIEDRYAWLGVDTIREVDYADGQFLMEVSPSARPALTEEFRELQAQTTTLLGTPVGPVADPGRIMESKVEFDLTGSAPGIPIRAHATIRNPSTKRWPVLGGPPDRQVQFAYRWEDANGAVLPTADADHRAPLPFDLGPGESLSTTLCVTPPAATGQVYLVVGVAQGESWFRGTPARAPLELSKFDPTAFAK